LILVDTSVWVDHFRRGNARLQALLRDSLVLVHPFVLGELALGRLEKRSEVLGLLAEMPQAKAASHDEVLEFIERRGLAGRGIGWVDVHLLASAALAEVPLWTVDRRLAVVAERLAISA
jgi:predicted nucleic acid-binding protein